MSVIAGGGAAPATPRQMIQNLAAEPGPLNHRLAAQIMANNVWQDVVPYVGGGPQPETRMGVGGTSPTSWAEAYPRGTVNAGPAPRNRGSVNLTLDLIDSIANENGKYRTRMPDYKRVNGKWVKTGGEHLDWVKQPKGMALERQMQGIGALIHEFAHTRQKPNQYNVVRDEGGADAFAALLYQKILKDLGFNEPRSAYQGYEQNYGLHYMARHGKNAALHTQFRR